jgi:hypothetical protein
MQKILLPTNEGINLIMKNKTILITGGTTGISPDPDPPIYPPPSLF